MLTDAAIAALAAARHPFAFFPPVRGLPDNRWRFSQATRAEFAAINVTSGEQVWFPRGGVSYVTIEEGAITIALRRELECLGGAVWPVQKESDGLEPGREAEAETETVGRGESDALPGESSGPMVAEPPRPRIAGVARQRLRSWSDEPLLLALAASAGAALVFFLALLVARAWLRPPPQAGGPGIDDPRLFTLVREDSYHEVLRKLGPPPGEKRLSAPASDLQLRALLYPDRDYAFVLMGVQGGYEQEPRYIGAIRLSDSAVLASVALTHNSTTDSLLKNCARQLRSEK